MEDKTTIGISDTLREFIEALVEEVVINGEPFDAQKKWLRKYSEAEGLNYDTVESNLNDFFEAIKELEEHESKSAERFARNLAQSCFISETEVDKFIDHAVAVRAQKEADRIAAEQEAALIAAQKEAERKAQEEKEQKAREEAERKAQEKAERRAREERERKAREEAERKAKEDTDRVEFLRCSEEAWNSVPLLSCRPLKYILLDKQTMSVAIALDRIRDEKPKEITIPSTFTDSYKFRIYFCFNVTSIYDYAFIECDWLESITIPSSVKSVGRLAFLNCRNLSRVDIQGKTLFVSRDSFENTPFENSPAYKEAVKEGKIVVASETNMIKTHQRIHPYFILYDTFWKRSNFSDGRLKIYPETKPPITPAELVIPVKTGEHDISYVEGFSDCETVRSIIFRSRPFLEIGRSAFKNCKNLESVFFESIQNLVIRREAFAYCSKLSLLTFTPNDTSKNPYVEDPAFNGCNLPLGKRIEVKRYEWKSY